MAPQPILNDGNVVLDPSEPTHQNGHSKDIHNNKSPSKLTSTPPETSVLHRSIYIDPQYVAHASGLYLTLTTGQRIVDATGGAAVACLGHNNARVNSAIQAQLSRFSYCHSLFFSSPVAEEFAHFMTESTGRLMSKLFVVSSGSEAMEASVKLARQYFIETEGRDTPRCNFIARRESYHGTTLGALSMSGHVARRAIFEPLLLPNVSRVSACNAYRGMREGESTEQYVQRLAQELDDEFKTLGPGTVVAFVAEPTVGAALGCVPAVPGYFVAMKEVCDRHGALMIMDEVMCGMGRTGTLHAWQQEAVVPDIQTIGKGLGGGFVPIAGVLINDRVVNALRGGTGAFMHGQTYQGHPLACAGALEVQKIIRDDNLLENVKITGNLLASVLKQKLSDHPNVGDIRGKGLFWGIEFVRDKMSKTPFDPTVGLAMAIHQRGLQEPYNISLYPGTGTMDGVKGDHILVSPPFNCSKDEIMAIANTTVMVILDVLASISTSSKSV